jgi:hypothetical protein
MAKMMPNRINNDIKNKWYNMVRKEARRSRIDSTSRADKLATTMTTVDSSASSPRHSPTVTTSHAPTSSTAPVDIDTATITRAEAV